MQEINKYNLEEFQKLNEKEKRNVFNHVWNPHNPETGIKLKSQIIDEFIGRTNSSGKQYGIKSFGWTVYMLYVVVDNSKIRIPTSFFCLPVNKGIILKQIDNEIFLVKFNYGGKMELNLNEKIIIK